MDEKNWIPQSNLFSGLKLSEKQALLSMGRTYSFTKDQYIFQAHNPGKSIYLLIGGHAKVFHVSETGKEVILWFCLPGEVFGLAECLNGGLRKVYAQACSHATVIAIPENEFNQFLSSNSNLAIELIQLLSNRLRILSNTLLSVSTDDAESKIKHVINRLAQCYGTRHNNEIEINFTITHQEIGDMIGVSRQTVTTIINNLKKQNILFIKNHKIYLIHSQWSKSESFETTSRQNSSRDKNVNYFVG